MKRIFLTCESYKDEKGKSHSKIINFVTKEVLADIIHRKGQFASAYYKFVKEYEASGEYKCVYMMDPNNPAYDEAWIEKHK